MKPIKIFSFTLLLIFLINSMFVSAISQAPYTFYGTAYVDDDALTSADTEYTVSLVVDGIKLINYTMGDIDTNDYVLIVPMDTDCSIPTAACSGDIAYIYINDIPVAENTVTVGAPMMSNHKNIHVTMSKIENISSCVTLDESGDYYLTEDILNSNADRCIEIIENNVTLYCNGHMIDGIDSESTTYGIYSQNNNTLVHNCTIADWTNGISYSEANSGHILNNKIYSNTNKGILFTSSSHNKIAFNELYENDVGVRLEDSSNNNEIRDNKIINNNKGISITVDCTNPNIIYNNYISGNVINAEDKGISFWNTGLILSGPNIMGGQNISGNYFSDYKGIDANGDGFGDTPHIIEGNNQDNFPLSIPEVPTIFLSIGLLFFSLVNGIKKVE